MRKVRSIVVAFLALCIALTTVAQAEAPKAVLLLAAQSEQGTMVTFGRDAQDVEPLGRTIRAPFEKAGIDFVSALNIAPIIGTSAQDLPLGDAAAAAMATSAGAKIAVVVGLVAKDQGSVRATLLTGQLVTVRLRVLDVAAGRAIFDSKAKAASYGNEPTLARAEGSVSALDKVSRGLLGKLLVQWPVQSQAQGRLTVSISGAEGWRPIATVLRSLAAIPGVSSVHALEINPDRVFLSLESQQGAAQVVASLRRARIRQGSLAVELAGQAISIRIMMNVAPILAPVNNG